MRQRHNKFENTPYALEPNCKESPGGLRDLQVILWVAKRCGPGQRPGTSWPQGPGHPFRGAQQIKRNEALLQASSARGCTSWRAGAKTAWSSTCRRRWPHLRLHQRTTRAGRHLEGQDGRAPHRIRARR
jgi:hypothetical protein